MHAGRAGNGDIALGTRLFGQTQGWDGDIEVIFQGGRFTQNGPSQPTVPIAAWTVASTIGHRLNDVALTPRLALSTNIASGDRGRRTLNTFSALFPRGNYFSEAAVLGPRNFWNVHGFLNLVLPGRVDYTVDVNVFWQLESQDGIYGVPGNLLRPSGGPGGRVDTAISNVVGYAFNRNVDASAIYTLQFSGPAVAGTGPAPTMHFVELTLRLRL